MSVHLWSQIVHLLNCGVKYSKKGLGGLLIPFVAFRQLSSMMKIALEDELALLEYVRLCMELCKYVYVMRMILSIIDPCMMVMIMMTTMR